MKSASSRSSRQRAAVTRSPLAMRGAQRLAHAPLVGADDDVREVEHLGRAAVVLLEAHDVRLGKVLVEVEDVPDVGAAPAVDRLVVVTDDADVAVAAGEQLDELVLRAVGVLVLVDEDVLELAAVLLELRRILGEQSDGEHEQIVEVHGVGQRAAPHRDRDRRRRRRARTGSIARFAYSSGVTSAFFASEIAPCTPRGVNCFTLSRWRSMMRLTTDCVSS